MGKQIYRFASVFLQMNRLGLFLLMIFPLTIRVYTQPSEGNLIVNYFLGNIGWICLLSWVFAIGFKANEKLVSLGIRLQAFVYFNWLVLLIFISSVVCAYITTKVQLIIGVVHVSYLTPIYLPITLVCAVLITMIITAKALVSAELTKEAGVSDYFSTLLLLIFAPVGLWYIQPRVQKI